ncbi:MAG TPA: nucleoside recognition domain-containing protein, partial [Anaerovoracaceae bacterium]|nr:nucleoside recognition domain-containing protein [Anaerovoracaceae bacterium]
LKEPPCAMHIGNYYLSFIKGLVTPFCSEDSFLGSLLIGQYGILTMTPAYLFGLLLPLVAGFYFLHHVLDESRLFPRIAGYLNKPLHFLGLNGNAIVPLVLGFGCVTVALISTAILGTRRERLIASVLLCIAVPCSAQVAIIFSFAFLLGPKYFLFYLSLIFCIFLLLGTLLNLLLPGALKPVELPAPPLQFPDLKKIVKKTAGEAVSFLKETAPTFLIGGIAVAILDYYNGFMILRRWFAPITVEFLRIPENATNLFVMSIIKRDLGAAGFYSMVMNGSFTQKEILVTLIVLTLFVPCFASQMILFRQGKARVAVLIWLGSFAVAFAVGGLVSRLII